MDSGTTTVDPGAPRTPLAPARSATPPPRFTQAGQPSALREDLLRSAYTADAVAELLGPVAAAALARDQRLPARRRLAGVSGPLATLVRLFSLGDEVSAADAAQAFAGVTLAAAEEVGLVARRAEQGAVRALCDLQPQASESASWWIASDLDAALLGTALPADHVLGVGAASLTLAAWTPRAQVERALDLGTGCGIQAVLLDTHAEAIVATDLSDRALAFARFNAALNDRAWDVRSGSLLTPVDGETFDLVVSNPPFVITPRRGDVPRYEYRDGGLAGDDLTWDLVASIGRTLNPGGLACLLANWEVTAGSSWRTRWESAAAAAGVDLLVLRREATDPAQYAETWAADGGASGPEVEAWYAAWLDDFAEREVTEIDFGIVIAHRPSRDRPTWLELKDVRHPVGDGLGAAVAAEVRARSMLAVMSDEEMCGRAWRCAPDVIEEQAGLPGQGPSVLLVRRGSGLRREHQLSTALASLVRVCDGDLTAGQALTAIAALLEEDADAVRREAAPMLRLLIAEGFLVEP